MCFYSTESTPSTAATVSTKTLAVSLLIFQWVTSFMFMMTNYKGYTVVSTLVLSASAIACVVFWYKYRRIINLLLNSESEMIVSTDYVHPLDLERQEKNI